MISPKEIKFEQDNPVPNGTVCVALYDATPEYDIDLDFKKGEEMVIVEPCNVLFFYIGRNSLGNEGVIPINYFRFDTSKQTKPQVLQLQTAGSPNPSHSPRVAPKPRRSISNESPHQPQKPKPIPRPRGETMPRGQSLPSHSSLDDDTASSTNYPDIDKRPPMPLPQEVVVPSNSSMSADKFKTDSGWFTPNLSHVSHNVVY